MQLFRAQVRLNMMAAYAKGARWERLAKEELESLGFQVFRVAGSHKVDLVIPLLTIEVKYRHELPKIFQRATHGVVRSKSGFEALPLQFLSLPNLLPIQEVKDFGNWEGLVPENGALLLKAFRMPWIVLGRADILAKLRR